MLEIFSFLGVGLILGLANGMTPGPLMTMIFSETLHHGQKAGIKVAVAPLFTDIPVVFSILFIVSRFSKVDSIIGAISIIGALVLGYYSYENIFAKAKVQIKKTEPKSFRKGILTNFFNPHLYINSFAVHTPIMLRALRINILAMIIYFAGFVLALVSSKIILAILIGKSKKFFESKYYIYAIKALGFILLLFAVVFLTDGLKYFKII